MVDMSDTVALCDRVEERCSSIKMRAAQRSSQRNMRIERMPLDANETRATITEQRNEKR